MRQIEKPELISTIIDKKKVWYNIRESRLSYMLHRKLISVNKYEAGSRYRRLCEIATSGLKSCVQDVRIDGSKPDMLISKLGAIFEMVRISEEIGSHYEKVLKFFCWENYGIIEIANKLGITERRASNYVHDGLSALAIYYGYEKVRNTIRGQGTKAKRYKIPEMGK